MAQFKVLKDIEVEGTLRKEGEVIEMTKKAAGELDAASLELVETQAPPSGSDTVTLKKSELREFLQEMKEESGKELRAEIDELKKTNAMLLEIADEKNLSNWMSKHRKDAGTFVRLSTFQGKVITEWKTILDEVVQDTNTGRWTEKQLMRVTFEDKTESDHEYRRFTDLLRLNQVTAKVLERTQVETTDPNLKKFRFKVRREDNGKEYEIMDAFVN